MAGGASNAGGAVLASFFTSDELDRLSAAIAVGRPSALDYYPLLAPARYQEGLASVLTPDEVDLVMGGGAGALLGLGEGGQAV